MKAAGISTVIVIDALDECRDNEPASAILSLLARHIANIPLIEFFVTGRPELPIRKGFRLPALQPLTEIFDLHDVVKSSVDHDIELFLRTRLEEAVKGRSDVDLPSPWPSIADIQTLTTKAGQLFIFAATAIAFIAPSIHQLDECLALLKDFPEKNTLEGRHGIDRLYTTVLDNSHAMVLEGEDSAILTSIIGLIVLARNPLSGDEIAAILGIR